MRISLFQFEEGKSTGYQDKKDWRKRWEKILFFILLIAFFFIILKLLILFLVKKYLFIIIIIYHYAFNLNIKCTFCIM